MNPSRREVLYGGFAAAAWGLGFRTSFPASFLRPCGPSGGLALDQSAPVADLPDAPTSVLIDGLPFGDWFTGDAFRAPGDYPFHNAPPCCAFSDPPAPTDEIDVAVIGGGLSGLACGYLLRHRGPVVFELQSRFGGNARGERWRGTSYPIGSAYVITPDRGTFLWRLYHELGLHHVRREALPPDPVEIGGVVRDDFWSGAGRPPAEQAAFQRYAEVVRYMANERYPDIPLPAGDEAQWIIDLDRKTFRQDIEERMGVPMPPLLAAAVQAYCYSSFGVGFDEISAAAGWNFLAAEEFGRWVFPGGNAYIVQALWERVGRLERAVRPECRPYHLRAQCSVVDVRMRGANRVQVTYVDASGGLRSLTARYAIIACPKHVARHILHGIEQLDERKLLAMGQTFTRPYVVANVLLNAPIQRDFYDMFLVGDESFPMTEPAVAANSRPTDLLRGDYAERGAQSRGVLSLFWPLPFGTARFTLIRDGSWTDYAERLAPRVRQALDLLNVPTSAVRQVRMTRWGHALPFAPPGLMAQGFYDELRRPLGDRIYFVNQDNWLLPAVENSLLDAESVCDTIRTRLP
ncbi:MAG: FAD-dependent oxidoreductase [Phycisphaerae bacterium]